MTAAEQARQALEEIGRLAQAHAQELATAFQLLDRGALRGPAANRLGSELMRNHGQLRHAFSMAFDHVARVAAAAEGPRVPSPSLGGMPVPGPVTRGGMVGGDPELLAALARELSRSGRVLQNTGETVAGLMLRSGADAAPGRLIGQVGDWATGQRGDLLRRREALLREAALGSDPTLGALIGYTLAGLPSTIDWDPGVTDPQARRLAAVAAHRGTPAERAHAVRTFFARLTKDQQTALALTHPDLVGNLDGAPHTARYAANRLRIQQALAQERARLATMPPDDPARKRAEARRDRFWEFLQPRAKLVNGEMVRGHRQFLLFDASGDGRAAEVFGNLDTAKRVSVSVPGVTNRIDNFDGPSKDVENLYNKGVDQGREDIAAIAWLGYDTPGLVDGQLPAAAEKGGPDLHAFRAGLNLSEDAETTLIAHSYGTRVSFEALRGGADFDNVVFMGSPGLGMDVDSVADMSLPHDTEVYAMRALGDYISYSENAGPDPAAFADITRLATGHGPDAPSGHSQYYQAGTLSQNNLAAVAWGTSAPKTTETLPRQEAWWATADQVFVDRLLKHVPPEQMRAFAAKAAPLMHELEVGSVELDGSDRSLRWVLRLASETDVLDYLTPAELRDALASSVAAQAYWSLRDRGVSDPAARTGAWDAKAAATVAFLPVQAALEKVRLAENAADTVRLVGGAVAHVATEVRRQVGEVIDRTVRDTIDFGRGVARGVTKGPHDVGEGLRELAEDVADEAKRHPYPPWMNPEGRP